MMDEISRLRKLYELKNVERMNSVKDRKESSAEHSWSCLMLADYFLQREKTKLDRLRVFELLMYHDLVEIISGDIPIHFEEERKNKKADEKKAFLKLREDIPPELKEKYSGLFEEFEEGKTKEAKFARAIDKIDAELHELDYKDDWKGWSEEMLRGYMGKYHEEFPDLKRFFEKLLKFSKDNDYYH